MSTARRLFLRQIPSEGARADARVDTSSILPRPILAGTLVLFGLSGCAALIYEVVWFQLLQLVIGSSAVSVGVLLGTFMGGMCLGSLSLNRFIPPSIHPLRVFACLELGTGLCGLALLSGLPVVNQLYEMIG